MDIADKSVVTIHFNLTDDDGKIIDTSEGKEPLVYMHGTKSLIPGLEKELIGKTTGDKMQVTVQPEDGYGNVNLELIQEVPRSAFQGVNDIQPGMQFEAKSPEGHKQLVTIQEVGENNIKVNGNHPLAGKVLHFDISVEDVREATEEEIAHGHAHAPGHSH
ncbi:MAG: FKBP-type peptidyl-prolyl cis-trans isomerase [Thermodesulfobacteriota bacterium]